MKIGPTMAAPTRTCIGCRRRDAAAELVRLALVDGTVVVANRSSRTGRGASLHARPACLEAGLRLDVLSRAFKRRVTIPDATKLLEQITKVENREKR
jgi:predicted RNA-binding protein YlxR (DUF448 family)